jgi:chemotaxis protein histidine kinase CheA
MSWRSKRRGDKAEQTLAAATIARVTGEEGSLEAGEAAVRGVLARAELERPIVSILIVALDDAPLAEQLGAALGVDRDVEVVTADSVPAEQADAAFAVASTSLPTREIVDVLGTLDAILLGIVLADEPVIPASDAAAPSFDPELEHHLGPPPEETPEASGDDGLEALAALERAAGSTGLPPFEPIEPVEPISVHPEPVDAEPTAAEQQAGPEPAQDGELERRLIELTHREVALRRITEALEQQRTRLEAREAELEQVERVRASEGAADDTRLAEAEERVARVEALVEQAERRATHAEARVAQAEQRAQKAEQRARAAEERARAAEQRIVELEVRRVEPPPPAAPVEEFPVEAPPSAAAPPARYGTSTLPRLEQLVQDAAARNDPRAEEWAYYLPLLREHADRDGRLPVQFDTLVDGVFGDASFDA